MLDYRLSRKKIKGPKKSGAGNCRPRIVSDAGYFFLGADGGGQLFKS
jgi:hypothetical protein